MNSKEIQALEERVTQALAGWYEKHFHRGTTQKTPVITASDKDELHKAVVGALPEPAAAKIPAPPA